MILKNNICQIKANYRKHKKINKVKSGKKLAKNKIQIDKKMLENKALIFKNK